MGGWEVGCLGEAGGSESCGWLGSRVSRGGWRAGVLWVAGK